MKEEKKYVYVNSKGHYAVLNDFKTGNRPNISWTTKLDKADVFSLNSAFLLKKQNCLGLENIVAKIPAEMSRVVTLTKLPENQ